jgi:YbbR domain-containing protein
MRRWLDRTFSERARLFLLALAIAVTTWYYVGASGQPQGGQTRVASLQVRNVEVTFMGLGLGWSGSANPRTVDIEMRGPADAVLAVRPDEVRAFADVRGLDPGAHQVPIRIPIPRGVTAAQATPPAVTVTLLRP